MENKRYSVGKMMEEWGAGKAQTLTLLLQMIVIYVVSIVMLHIKKKERLCLYKQQSLSI